MTTVKGFSTTPGVLSLMASARSSNDQIKYLLNGDLNQMAIQKEFLISGGHKVGMNNVYPGFYTEEEYKQGLREIWDNKVYGWWNYRDECIRYKICNADGN